MKDAEVREAGLAKARERARGRSAVSRTYPVDPERADKIVRMRAEGQTLDAIAKEFGISRSRVDQIHRKELRLIQRRKELAEANRRWWAYWKKKHRARYVRDITGVEPATDWRTPEAEWQEIQAGR